MLLGPDDIGEMVTLLDSKIASRYLICVYFIISSLGNSYLFTT